MADKEHVIQNGDVNNQDAIMSEVPVLVVDNPAEPPPTKTTDDPVKADGRKSTATLIYHELKGTAPHHHPVARPAALAHKATSYIQTRYSAVNWAWGVTVTMLLPIAGSVVWFGCIPVGSPLGDFSDKAVWIFVVNPLMMTFLCYLLMSIFFLALDPSSPWRPFATYFHVLLLNYLLQLIFPGLYVVFEQPFELMALPVIALTLIVTLLGVRVTPLRWFGPQRKFCPAMEGTIEEFRKVYRTYKNICIVFMAYAVALALFSLAQVKSRGTAGQGFVTVGINVVAFIFKKILLAMTDSLDLETSMIVAGLWVENLTDVFIATAFPSAQKIGATFAIVFALRTLENMATLAFQIDPWFKFRVWIKSKFKPDQKQPIEEDIDPDDRGHSNSHPGYRRRQFRFLTFKFISQIQSYLFFLILAPVLRYGPNSDRFPYSSNQNKYVGTTLGNEHLYLSARNFEASMTFAAISIATVFVAMALSWWYMRRYHKDILITLAERYDAVVVSAPLYSLVLCILTTNSLIAIMYLQVYYRVYFF